MKSNPLHTAICVLIVLWQALIVCPFLLFALGLLSPAAMTAVWQLTFDFAPVLIGTNAALFVGFIWTLPEENK